MGINLELLGRRLRERRRELKITQTELSKATGISKSYISRLERADGFNPSLIYLVKLCNALDISLYWVIGLKDDRGTEQEDK